MKIEMWPTDRPKAYTGNPRVCPDEAVDAVALSIKEYGFKIPLLVDQDGVLIAGHTRLLAAKKLGLSEVPVVVADDLTEEQVRGLRIADNKVHEFTSWDFDLLGIEIGELEALDFDLASLGFDENELAKLLDPGVQEGLTDPDEIPEPPEEPIARPGDLWLLGEHRLLCGDATVATDVERLFADKHPFMMVCDPPYGVQYDPAWRHSCGLNNSDRTGKVANDERVSWAEAYSLFPGDVAYVWHAGKFANEVADDLESCGLEIRAQIIWAKPRFAISRGHYHWQHEPNWYAVRKGATSRWCGDRKQSTLWQIELKFDESTDVRHGTEKPVECMLRPIRNHGSVGDVVYDPFVGSGTTLIACEQSNRQCLAMEIDPRYVDTAVLRWENFTGQKAERQIAQAA